MEENTKAEQIQNLDEEQLQVITGAAGQPSFELSPMSANRWMGEQLFNKAQQAAAKGYHDLSNTIMENAIKHFDRAEVIAKDIKAGKRPMTEQSTKPSTSTSSSEKLRLG